MPLHFVPAYPPLWNPGPASGHQVTPPDPSLGPFVVEYRADNGTVRVLWNADLLGDADYDTLGVDWDRVIRWTLSQDVP